MKKFFSKLKVIMLFLLVALFLAGCAPSRPDTVVRVRIAELFPDESLAFAVARAINVDVNAEIDSQRLREIDFFNIGVVSSLPGQRPVQDLTGMEHLAGLELVGLSNNQISDLTPLASLTNLTDLFLYNNNYNNNQTLDLTPLAALTNLTTLGLGNSQINDLTPLAGLTNLTTLRLDNNQIIDLTPLAGLTNLTNLDVNNQIIRLSERAADREAEFDLKNINGDFISLTPGVGDLIFEHGLLTWLTIGDNHATWDGLTGIGNIRFSGTLYQTAYHPITVAEVFPDESLAFVVANELGVSADAKINPQRFEEIVTFTVHNFNLFPNRRHIQDLTGIERLVNLTNARLSNSRIRDFTPLASLPNLTRLDLQASQVADTTPFADLTNLTILELGNNPVRDVRPLADLTNLTVLRLSGPRITDVTPLAGLINLTELQVHNAQVSDVAPLAGLTNLTELRIYDNLISDITPLAGLTNLTDLHIRDNPISDVRPLATLTNLTTLSINNGQISDITPLASLTNLELLHIHDNQVSNIAPLAGLTNLTHLQLQNNQISNIASLAGLTNLMQLQLHNNQISNMGVLSDLNNLRAGSTFHNQIIMLPVTMTDQQVDFALTHVNGEVAELVTEVGDFAFDNGVLTWKTTGHNYATWDAPTGIGNVRFSGIVHQDVYRAPDQTSIDAVMNFLTNNSLDNQFLIPNTNEAGIFFAVDELLNNMDDVDDELTVSLVRQADSDFIMSDDNTVGEISNFTINLSLAPYEFYLPYNIEHQTIYFALTVVIAELFPDESLAFAVARELNVDVDEKTHYQKLKALRVLNANDVHNFPNQRPIQDLTGMEYLVGLAETRLNNNHISDLRPLANLTNLTILHLHNNQISDLSPLKNLNLGVNFVFVNQTITLANGVAHEETEFVLKKINGEAISLAPGAGDFTFENSALTWTTAGHNLATWNAQAGIGNHQFSGVVFQSVYENPEITPDVTIADASLAIASARALDVSVVKQAPDQASIDAVRDFLANNHPANSILIPSDTDEAGIIAAINEALNNIEGVADNLTVSLAWQANSELVMPNDVANNFTVSLALASQDFQQPYDIKNQTIHFMLKSHLFTEPKTN